jgi:hypothetical protein
MAAFGRQAVRREVFRQGAFGKADKKRKQFLPC